MKWFKRFQSRRKHPVANGDAEQQGSRGLEPEQERSMPSCPPKDADEDAVSESIPEEPTSPPLFQQFRADGKTSGVSGETESPIHSPHESPNEKTIVIGDGGNHNVIGIPGLSCDSVDPVPDAELDWGDIEGLTIRAASIRGRSHRYERSIRQDSFNTAILSGNGNTYLFLCVADGLGSYPLSHIAAKVASSTASIVLKKQIESGGTLDRIETKSVVDRIQRRLLYHVQKQESNPELSIKDVGSRMKTTISIALVPIKANEEHQRMCQVFTIGDTSAWILKRERGWQPVTPVKGMDSELFSSKVAAIPSSSEVRFQQHECVLERGDTFFLMSDGIGDPLGDGSGLTGNILAERLRRAPDIYDFARICDFARRSHMDDRTLLGVWIPAE